MSAPNLWLLVALLGCDSPPTISRDGREDVSVAARTDASPVDGDTAPPSDAAPPRDAAPPDAAAAADAESDVGPEAPGDPPHPAVCDLPVDRGDPRECELFIDGWWHNRAAGRCEPFRTCGNQENANYFATLDTCAETCLGGPPRCEPERASSTLLGLSIHMDACFGPCDSVLTWGDGAGDCPVARLLRCEDEVCTDSSAAVTPDGQTTARALAEALVGTPLLALYPSEQPDGRAYSLTLRRAGVQTTHDFGTPPPELVPAFTWLIEQLDALDICRPTLYLDPHQNACWRNPTRP